MIAAFSVTPIGTPIGTPVGTPLGPDPSVGRLVAEAVQLVRDSGLPNETNAMFTNIEGEWDEVMGVIKACVEKVAAAAPRVSVVVKIDYRPGTTDALHHKVESVERWLQP